MSEQTNDGRKQLVDSTSDRTSSITLHRFRTIDGRAPVVDPLRDQDVLCGEWVRVSDEGCVAID